MKVLVTGGSGFLGLAIVRKLVARGDEVASLSRHKSPHIERLGVRQFASEISDFNTVRAASAGMDAVIHTAAKAGVWGSYNEYYSANVLGTEAVIAACVSQNISTLVYTSSPSVVFDGKDQEGVDETTPFPEKYLASYPATKAIAERLVTGCNIPQLKTVALRPHLIWGPGDNQLVPRIVMMGRAGKLRLVGNGGKLVDAVYIDNAADAHIVALDRLYNHSLSHSINRKVYFITNHEPLPMKQIVTSILRSASIDVELKSVPEKPAFLVGVALEWAGRLTGKKSEPRLTRFTARQLATAHWYDNTAAIRDLHYKPSISMAEGFKKLALSFGI